MKKCLSWSIVAIFAGYAFHGVLPTTSVDFDWQTFGGIPILANGRFQPLDSLARNALLQLREKATAISSSAPKGSERGRVMPAAEWLAEVIFNPNMAETRPNFRIDNLELKQTLALPVEPDDTKRVDGKHYSYAQIRPQLISLQEQARQAAEIKSELHTRYQRAVLQLWKRVQLFWQLENLAQPRVTDFLAALRAAAPESATEFLRLVAETQPQNAADWPGEVTAFLHNRESGRAALLALRNRHPYDPKALLVFKRDLVRFEAMSMKGQAFLIPPENPESSPDAWRATSDALFSAANGHALPPTALAYIQMGAAFRTGRAADFNSAAAQYLALVRSQLPRITRKAAREQWFNRLSPFTRTMVIYLAAALSAICFWFAPVRGEWLRHTAVLLCGLALVIHAGGLLFRMALEGRPPVTNLYSAAVFIGFAGCVLGLVLETVWRNSIGIIVSSMIGFATLLVAHHLALAGDTMEMMRAVLDTNFWLSTHVVIVTLGYASTFVSGFLGVVFLIWGIFTSSLTAPLRQSLSKMIYAITCFAALFSFVGTVLGGIWADQSWGRFWGWDPKENGALIIVLWNVLILHARWGGMVRERGLANLAIVGNIVTSWSFFGTNMLGIGLHSYGFMDEERLALLLFVASQLLLVALGSLPLRLWSSFGPERDATPSSIHRSAF